MSVCSEVEAVENLTRILGTNNFTIHPIGNHSLGRHLVYRVESFCCETFIYKQYCKKNRRARELTALKKLESSKVPCPRIKSYGVTEHGIEWMILSFLEGTVLDSLWDQLNKQQKKGIFFQMGSILSAMHSVEKYDRFGYWNEKGECSYEIHDYYTEFCRRNETVFRQLENQHLPDKNLLEKAVCAIKKNSVMVKEIKDSHLTHQDYDGRNILVSIEGKDARITGVLDFEQSSAGNTEIDLSDVYFRYFLKSDEFEAQFKEGYQKNLLIDPNFFHRMPLYLLCKGVSICSWSYMTAPDYYREGIELIKLMIERL